LQAHWVLPIPNPLSPITNHQSHIANATLRRGSRCLKDSYQLVRLSQQALQLRSFDDACISDQFQPESCFVSLFDGDPDF
jgi:hypothetical protein